MFSASNSLRRELASNPGGQGSRRAAALPLMDQPGPRLPGFAIRTGFLIWICLAASPSVAGILNTVGAVIQPFPLPLSVLQNHTESDANILILPEQQNLTLTDNLLVDIVTPGSFPGDPLSTDVIPAGTKVSSYLLHADRVDAAGQPPLVVNGSVEFEEKVLGLIILENSLNTSDGILGASAINHYYPTGKIRRGIELNGSDLVQWSGDIVEFGFEMGSIMDQVRIITVAEPEGVTFSIDVQGPTGGSFGSNDNAPTASFPGNFYFPISGGDILTVGRPGGPGPNPPVAGPLTDPDDVPGIVVFAGDGNGLTRGLDLMTVKIGPNDEPENEVDALSYGRDRGNAIRFSVDEFVAGNQIGIAPNDVIVEGATGKREASADVFTFRGTAVPRVLPTVFVNGNTSFIDGDASELGTVGLGLVEPNPPNRVPSPPKSLPDQFDQGDNLDAMDLDTTPGDLEGYIYFSLDGGFDDPLETGDVIGGRGPNIGTAQANPVFGITSGAAVLVQIPGIGKAVYASPAELGLDSHCSGDLCDGSDDVDSLILRDFGDPAVFDPSGDGDFLLFSVRRGSAVIGVLDSRLGVPIGEGDILMAPLEGTNVPQIFIPAELLGLASARRGSDFAAASVGLVAVAGAGAGVGEDVVAMDLALTSLVDGDMDCSGLPLDAGDIDSFALAIRNAAGYAGDIMLCLSSPVSHGNFDGDSDFDFDDITGFVNEFASTGVMPSGAALALITAFPEPTSASLGAMALVFLVGYGRRRELT